MTPLQFIAMTSTIISIIGAVMMIAGRHRESGFLIDTGCVFLAIGLSGLIAFGTTIIEIRIVNDL